VCTSECTHNVDFYLAVDDTASYKARPMALVTNTPHLGNSVSFAETGDFRVYLQRELISRCRANPRYSLRAFARNLDIEPSHLSKILKGKRPVAPKLLEHMSQRLDLPPSRIESFKARLPKRWRKKDALDNRSEPQRQIYQIPLDAFEIISDWHHYAILELIKIRGFRPEPKWIARKLGVTPTEVHCYMDRLVRVGILEIDRDGNWTDSSGGFSTHVLGENYTSYAHKKAQSEILKMAADALMDIPIERRDQSSTMITTNVEKLQAAKKMIKSFRMRLMEFLEDCDEKNAIYQLSVSLFPLIENEE
jgi:uncharacterized protein (TIGR02147 family)